MRSTWAIFSLVALGLAACGQQQQCQPKKGKRCRSEATQEAQSIPEPQKAEATSN